MIFHKYRDEKSDHVSNRVGPVEELWIGKTKGIKNEKDADILLYTPLQNVSHGAGDGIGINLWLPLECTDLPENGFLLHARPIFQCSLP